ncbi:tRNA dimethylallyltransferase isoform X2 [Hylaeus volcanicus]|uniref:tRNA dimethylallyltransferase isoform X2 n=1 Tax=Hylaeus volcanicus TaxID=313075 RepID=UPI0023B7F9CF|nr:tRNA dimethylallyltransferase isoform X2 [Hylaeus volcanicus]
MRSAKQGLSDYGKVDMSRVPVLVILGCTGCGKSRLGIELAKRFSGEIISADSMQVYKGLNIVTAKVTDVERSMAPHHMLDIVDPLSFDFNIDDLLARKKLPIVVGGTNYYIESLLWQILIGDPEMVLPSSHDSCTKETSDRGNKRSNSPSEEGRKVSFWKKRKSEVDQSAENNEELIKRLTEVDPEMAKRLHPNNTRKIIRSLEVFEQYGVCHSDILKAQRTAGGCGLGGPLRHSNSIVLWLRCDQKVLDCRLDSRVDAMLDAGLVDELLDFHRRYNKQRIKSNTLPDYTKGIFQTIGFKEFHAYLVLPEEERQSKKGQELLQQSIDFLKLVTKRYAKKQVKWITNRLIRRNDRQTPPVYSLDCTNLDNWNSSVLEPAVAIIDAVLRREQPTQKPLNGTADTEKVTDSSNEERHYCDVCERVFIGDFQWNIHVHSQKHLRVLKKVQKLKEEKEACNN